MKHRYIDYFNTWEFMQAYSNVTTNPYLSLSRYEEYIKKYPKDYSAYPAYISNLIMVRELDKAESIIDLTENFLINDARFANNRDKYDYVKYKLIMAKFKLLLHREQYESFYKLYNDNYNYLRYEDTGKMVLYCQKKLGILPDITREQQQYVVRQIIDYKKEDFFYHIQKHFADYNAMLDNPNSSIFRADFPITAVIDEIKKYIPSDSGLLFGYYQDLYVFKYEQCGIDRNKTTNYFRVITFHNNNDIITMFPSFNCNYLPWIDLNYMKEEETPKVKRKSQIDKFNQRYKL